MNKILILSIVSMILLSACATNNKEVLPNTGGTRPQAEEVPAPLKVNKKTKMDASNSGLDSFPDLILGLTDLIDIDISENNITGAIPAEIKNISGLKTLNLSNNKMTGLPAELGQLEYLEVLNVSNNQLTGLPHELANLKNLKTLDISGNDYASADLEIIIKGLSSDINIIK